MQRLKHYKAELLLLLTAMVWGSSYGVTKEALLFIRVPAFLALRFGLTFALLCPFLWRQRYAGMGLDIAAASFTGLLLCAIFLAEVYGVAQTSAAKAAFLISLCVMMTPFVEWLVFRQRPQPQLFLLALCSLGGVYLLSYSTATDTTLDLNSGDWLILLAAFLRALMGVLTKKVMQGRALSVESLTAVQAAMVALGALAVLMVQMRWQTNTGFSLPTSPTFWGLMIYLVLFCSVFAFFAINYGLRHTTPTRVALLTGTEPAFGAAFAVLYVGEVLTWYQWLGGALIVVVALQASRPVTKTSIIPVASATS